MNKKIIVTGGTGYIGSHTTVALQNAGFSVVIMDNLSNSTMTSIDGIEQITGIRPEFIKVDCADVVALKTAFSAHSDAIGVIHFAALKAVGESVAYPLKYYENNIAGTLQLLNIMKKY